jgi:hypothetical protein
MARLGDRGDDVGARAQAHVFPGSGQPVHRRANHFGLSESMSSPSGKNISVFQNHGSVYTNSIPSHSEGRCARSPMRDGDAVDADGAPDQDA